MKKRFFVLLLAVSCICNSSFAQGKPRYWEDVQTIKSYDRMYNPPASPIVFIGSSSIRKWDDAERTFAKNLVMNRGIGGAVVNDISFYLNDLLFAYKPRQVVIYVGENDLVDEASTPDSILNRTKVLFQLIREKLPNVPVVYISIKPSPSREKFLSKAIACNKLISSFLKADKHTVYVDIFTPMTTAAGKTRPELFVGDMLHMNAKGYEIWRKAVQPLLLKK